VRFEVRDAGPGILPAERARVFERFYTGDRARGSGGGTGLGLAIARHIIERLGGRIWVADRSPGTTICFTLPTAAPEGDTSAADDASALADEAAGEA
jgi:two-component system phosphate regulon sensor histidine kinase PhoR